MKQILLVEDVEEDRRRVRQVVNRMLNVKLLEAGNGLEAVGLAQRARPRVILMDLSLPVLSAWEAIARLKADPRTAGIPILALTAHGMLPEELRSREAGCDGYLTKPLEPALLKARLEPYLAS